MFACVGNESKRQMDDVCVYTLMTTHEACVNTHTHTHTERRIMCVSNVSLTPSQVNWREKQLRKVCLTIATIPPPPGSPQYPPLALSMRDKIHCLPYLPPLPPWLLLAPCSPCCPLAPTAPPLSPPHPPCSHPHSSPAPPAPLTTSPMAGSPITRPLGPSPPHLPPLPPSPVTPAPAHTSSARRWRLTPPNHETRKTSHSYLQQRHSHTRSHSNPHAHLIIGEAELNRGNPAHEDLRSPSPPLRTGSQSSVATRGSPGPAQRRQNHHLVRPHPLAPSSTHFPSGEQLAPESPVLRSSAYSSTHYDYPVRSNSLTYTERRASSEWAGFGILHYIIITSLQV